MYKIRGFKSDTEALAYENNLLLELSQKRLYQPQAEPPPEGQVIAPIDAVNPAGQSVDRWRDDPVAQQQLLRSNLKTLGMTDAEIASFLTIISKDLMLKMNKDWSMIANKLANRKGITASFLRMFVDDFFKKTNFGYYEDEV